MIVNAYSSKGDRLLNEDSFFETVSMNSTSFGLISDDDIIRNQVKMLKKRLITEKLGAKFCFSCDYSAVVSEIRKQAEVLSTKPNFYHWRAHSGAEVDLLIEWNGQYFPIEIKGTCHPKKSDAWE